MSPFRFAGQWTLFPLIAGAAVVTGGVLGVLHGWATTEQLTIEPWARELLRSPLLMILATAMIGMATNSWTIATITGALTPVTAEFATDIAQWYWLDGHSPMADEFLLRLPIALLAGGTLGLSGCVWHHESGYTRSIGAALLAGSLGWLCWRELATDDWPIDLIRLSGWLAGALAIISLARCRGVGQFVIGLVGAVLVTFGIDLIDAGGTFALQSSLTALLERWDQIIERLRSES